MSAGQFGKVKSVEDKRDSLFGEFLAPLKKAGLLPTLPKYAFGHGNDFKGDLWKMLGNGPRSSDESELPHDWAAAENGAGDCFFAGEAHRIMAANYNAGKPVPRFDAKCTLENYSAYTKEAFGKAYNPITGENDEGSEPRSGLKRLQRIGFKDADGKVHTIGDYLSVAPKNLEELYYLLYLLEGAGLGFEWPQSGMDQFNEHKVLKPVPGSQIVGGHWIFGCGTPLPPEKGYWTAISWGERVMGNGAYYEQFNDETWGIIMPESFKKTTGKDWEGHDPAQVEQYLTEVARKKAVVLGV